MSPTSRRLFRYWLLLLVPTLMVGGGAIALLRREQGRLAQQTADAQEARRTAVIARARLIAENVELLVGDVDEGLLETLAGAPPAGLDAFLAQWEKNNPLVRMAFRASATGQLLRPPPDAADEDARGFARRFPRMVGTPPPWQAAPVESVGKVLEDKKVSQESLDEMTRVNSNVTQVQSARRGVQELLKASDYASAPMAAPPPEAAQAGALADNLANNERRARVSKTEADQVVAASGMGRRDVAVAAPRVGAVRTEKETTVASAPVVRAKDATRGRRGWLTSAVDGRQHVIGWVRPGSAGEIRGVELEMTALLSRLGGALPAEFGEGEGYVLQDSQGRGWQQAGVVPSGGTAVTRLPLATALLPGWEVAAFFSPVYPADRAGGGFFGSGVLLVMIFILAIVAGGSLLMRQARRSEEEAAQKTSFVANVSHEFKTPLTTIRLYAELLEQGRIRDAAQGEDYLRTIGRETQRLARLVNNALDFSRLEQGQKKYARQIVELATEVARLLDTHAPRVAEAGMTLRRELAAPPVTVTADPDALEQIVLNLIDNACKYAADGGEIVVSVATRAPGGAQVRVADRGPGVPLGHRERIFEKFHRVDDALTAEKSGAGLGLSIARQLARGLGGELRYAARDGGGAEFILELP